MASQPLIIGKNTMKIYRALVFLTAVAFFVGCKASTSPNGTTTTAGSMTATVNGQAWSSTVIPGVSGGATAKRSNSGVVTVIGVSPDVTEITLEIMHPSLRTDTLVLSGDIAGYSQGVLDTSKAWITIPTLNNPLTGTITITQFDTVKKQISGQFHFVGRKAHTLTDTVTVTNGSFYQVSWD